MSKRQRSDDGADVSESVAPEPLPLESDPLPEPAPAPVEEDAAVTERQRLANPESDRDRLDALIAWGSALRVRGIVTSGDWEDFARLAGESSRAPTVR